MIPSNIILHCSATNDGTTFSWDAIKRYHVMERGWLDIGYHYGIENYGGDLIVLRGRLPSTMGAHCLASGMNTRSLGVCVVGNYDVIPPSSRRIKVTVDLLTRLCFLFNILPSNIFGHSEKDDRKTCPGKLWNMDKIRELVKVGTSYMTAKIENEIVVWR